MRKWVWMLLLAGVIAVGAYWLQTKRQAAGRPEYVTARVDRGAILSAVSSSGTLNAVVTVQVGSQVSGQIKELLADFNSEVRTGQVIARIDPVNFEARVRQAEADLAVARANVAIQRAGVERARAELENSRSAVTAAVAQTEKMKVSLEDSRRDLERKKPLYARAIISESQFETARAAFEQAEAGLRNAEAQEQANRSLVLSREASLKTSLAQVEHALAQVSLKEAALTQSRVDLNHSVIRSPVDGVVIDRSVDIGQTVAASLQAPTLFTIAQDLRKMQVNTLVDEADIGRIRVGQRAIFTVDAFPAVNFNGGVLQVRKAPQSVQNVVTYTVVISADNGDLRLLPGMTANVQMVEEEREDALRVPQKALRFTPAGNDGGPSAARREGGGEMGQGGRPGEWVQRLAEGLGLSPEQQRRLQEILAQGRQQIMQLRQSGAAPEEIKAEFERLRKASRPAIMALLTPEQQAKYQELEARRSGRAAQPGRVWLLGPQGEPQPVDVLTGISDGSLTEIVRGELSAGQEILVELKPKVRGSGDNARKRTVF